MKRESLTIMIEIAVMAAVAYVLGYVKLYQMPNGGSVSLEMLPVVIMAFRRGVRPGIITGILLGALQALLGGYIASFTQVALDYIIAFGVIGLSSVYGKSTPRAVIGIVFACLLRFASHTVVGVYAWEATWGGSIAYNGPYMFFSTIIVILVFIPLSKNKQLMSE